MCTDKPAITPAQIEICKKCKFASSKKVWCCKFGFYFIEPQKQVILPPQQPAVQTPKAKPTLLQMASDFAKAMLRWGKSGLACVSKEEYVRRRSICSECTDGWRCPHCGCMLWAKVALATEKCPQGKW